MAENQALKDDPATAGDIRRYLIRLRRLAARLDHRATVIRNGGFNLEAEAQAGSLADDSFAIRWALRQISPEAEAANIRQAGPVRSEI